MSESDKKGTSPPKLVGNNVGYEPTAQGVRIPGADNNKSGKGGAVPVQHVYDGSKKLGELNLPDHPAKKKVPRNNPPRNNPPRIIMPDQAEHGEAVSIPPVGMVPVQEPKIIVPGDPVAEQYEPIGESYLQQGGSQMPGNLPLKPKIAQTLQHTLPQQQQASRQKPQPQVGTDIPNRMRITIESDYIGSIEAIYHEAFVQGEFMILVFHNTDTGALKYIPPMAREDDDLLVISSESLGGYFVKSLGIVFDLPDKSKTFVVLLVSEKLETEGV